MIQSTFNPRASYGSRFSSFNEPSWQLFGLTLDVIIIFTNNTKLLKIIIKFLNPGSNISPEDTNIKVDLFAV